MSTERAPARRAAPSTVPRAEACFFHAADARPRFGWIHRAATFATTALVIVPPFGYEAICAHRSLRHLAEAAARAGLVAIRADLDGCGDSAGDDLDPARLDAWLASIDDACELARREGCARIILAGVRLGATLATLAAARRSDVAGLVAIAAVPVGKAWVREGRALQMQLQLAAPPDARLAPPDDVHELVGFALAADTRAALSQIDLIRATERPAPSVLVVDRDDLPANDKWIAALRALGAEVEHARLPGYVEMMLDPHRAEVPRAIVDATVAFAVARSHDTPPAPALASSAARPARPLVVAPRAELAVDGVAIAEELVAIDDCLVAIATRPRRPPTRAVVLLNAGGVYRVGPNRLHVPLARRLAARGLLVARVDLSGIGDARARPGADENVVYSEHAVADVAACVTWVRRQGAREVAVVGLCSGAYHALKAAVAAAAVRDRVHAHDARIDTIVPINPLTFFWKPGMPLDFAAFRVTADAARYHERIASADAWRKLLRGDVDIKRVVRVVVERGRAIAESRARDLLRRLRVPMRDDLGSELYALGRAGVAMRFVFADGDPGLAILREQGGSAVTRLAATGRLAIATVAGPDHTFTPRWSHRLLLEQIERAVAPPVDER